MKDSTSQEQRPDRYLMVKVSALHHLRFLKQDEIAERLRLPRVEVNHLLRAAEELGYVQAVVASPRGMHLDLETHLEERFRLSMVHVVAEGAVASGMLRPQLGAAAASYLTRSVRAGEMIGLAWGLSSLQNARVLQLLGDLGTPGTHEYGVELVRRLADLANAPPLLQHIEETGPSTARPPLRTVASLDPVFVGVRRVGSRREVRMCPDTSVRLGLTADHLQNIDRIIAVTSGTDTIAPIAAALESSLVDVLVTDLCTAERLLDDV